MVGWRWRCVMSTVIWCSRHRPSKNQYDYIADDFPGDECNWPTHAPAQHLVVLARSTREYLISLPSSPTNDVCPGSYVFFCPLYPAKLDSSPTGNLPNINVETLAGFPACKSFFYTSAHPFHCLFTLILVFVTAL